MCGIVGYVGYKEAQPFLLQGLKKLEYRGYDSAGVAIQNAQGCMQVCKQKGDLTCLQQTLQQQSLQGGCGMGHTRWATHGMASVVNAHPHVSCGGKVVVVHNGIIENYQQLKAELQQKGCTFASQTDTEVVANWLEYTLQQNQQNMHNALQQFMRVAQGSYALVVWFAGALHTLYAVKKDSPLVVGQGPQEAMLASDISALSSSIQRVYVMQNFEYACVTNQHIKIYNQQGKAIKIKYMPKPLQNTFFHKHNYTHYLEKEIYEQPQAVEKTLAYMLPKQKLTVSTLGLTRAYCKQVQHVLFLGCGSAYHVGVTLAQVVQQITGVSAQAVCASEFRYGTFVLPKHTVVVAISQSGETADTLASIVKAKQMGCFTLGVVNAMHSSISREVHHAIYTQAGPEISVATTKAYSAQLVVGYVLALVLAREKRALHGKNLQTLLTELKKIPSYIAQILQQRQTIQHIAKQYFQQSQMFLVGRALDYATVLEGALKIKEVSYIHAEAYPSGELKHGPISLIEPNTLLLACLTQPDIAEKTISNMVEAQSRGAQLVAITTSPLPQGIKHVSILLPPVHPLFSASVAIVPMQLLSYELSLCKGTNIDKPRNLAKSVTVE